jgi:RecA-family ATPase
MEVVATMPMDLAATHPEDAAARILAHNALRATPYRWPDPSTLPTRQWLLGHWLLRGEVTAIIAPGGTGKSTIGTAFALSLASGQTLLGYPHPSLEGVGWWWGGVKVKLTANQRCGNDS